MASHSASVTYLQSFVYSNKETCQHARNQPCVLSTTPLDAIAAAFKFRTSHARHRWLLVTKTWKVPQLFCICCHATHWQVLITWPPCGRERFPRGSSAPIGPWDPLATAALQCASPGALISRVSMKCFTLPERIAACISQQDCANISGLDIAAGIEDDHFSPSLVSRVRCDKFVTTSDT